MLAPLSEFLAAVIFVGIVWCSFRMICLSHTSKIHISVKRIVLVFKKNFRFFYAHGGCLIKTSYDNILYKFYPLTGKGLYSTRTVSLKLVFVLWREKSCYFFWPFVHVVAVALLSLICADEEIKRIINSLWWPLCTGHAWVGPIANALIFPQLTLEGLVYPLL